MSDTIPYLQSPTFSEALAEAERPVLVDFTAGWCPPCQAMVPVLDDIARTESDRLLLAKVDVDADPELAARFRVQSMPTFVLFVDGQERARVVGARPKQQLLDALGPFLDEAVPS